MNRNIFRLLAYTCVCGSLLTATIIAQPFRSLFPFPVGPLEEFGSPTLIGGKILPGEFGGTDYHFWINQSVRRVRARVIPVDPSLGIEFWMIKKEGNNTPIDILGENRTGPLSDATIDIWLDPGSYILRVLSEKSVTVDNFFTLEMIHEAKPFSSGAGQNSLEKPKELGFLNRNIELQDWVGPGDPIDYFRFEIKGAPRKVQIEAEPIENWRLKADLISWRGPGSDPVTILSGENLSGTPGNKVRLNQDLVPGTYYLAVSGSTPAESGAMNLSLTQSLLAGQIPFFLEPIPSLTVFEGDPAEFRAIADGIEPLTFQWRLNGNPIPGETSSILRIDKVDASHLGEYTVAASNGFGTSVSEPASLTLRREVRLTIRPSVTISWPEKINGASVSGWILEEQGFGSDQWTPSKEFVRTVSQGVVYFIVSRLETNGVLFRLRSP